MDFNSQMNRLFLQRIKLALDEPDERSKAHRKLRLEQTKLWSAATNDDLQANAEFQHQEFAKRGGAETLEQCLADAMSAREQAKQRLKNPRCW